MDYMSVLEHAREVCHETFPGHAGDIIILYMCQASQVIANLCCGSSKVLFLSLKKDEIASSTRASFRQ